MPIGRFIGIEACKSVFSDRSTFLLRSPEHYRNLYEDRPDGDTKGDCNEGIAETSDGGTAESTGFLASCWTILKKSEPTRAEWDIFERDEQNIVAIVTTPKLVCDFLHEAIELKEECAQRRFPFRRLKHHRVHYGKRKINHRNILDDVPFTKGIQFVTQKEYRFVLDYGWPHVIDSLIICSGIGYMTKRRGTNQLANFVNPDASSDAKEDLLEILSEATAGYGDFAGKPIPEIIANADVLS